MDCPICLEPFAEHCTQLKCGHKFCTPCIAHIINEEIRRILQDNKFVHNNYKCAMCRSPFLPSAYKNSAVMVVPFPTEPMYWGTKVCHNDLSLAQLIYASFGSVVNALLSHKENHSPYFCQTLYKVASNTLADVAFVSTKVEDCDELRECRALSLALLNQADKNLKEMESCVTDFNAEDYHNPATFQPSGFERMVHSFLITAATAATPTNEVSYREWVDAGRPARTETERPVEPDADLSGNNSPLIVDDGSEAVFFLCSVCNSLCDSYTESAPSQSSADNTSSMCFQCWQNMVNERVDRLEETEFP